MYVMEAWSTTALGSNCLAILVCSCAARSHPLRYSLRAAVRLPAAR